MGRIEPDGSRKQYDTFGHLWPYSDDETHDAVDDILITSIKRATA